MNEKPKEKGKANPFASFLRPTEDLLWLDRQSTAGQQPFFTRRRVIYVVAFIGITAAILMVLAFRFGGTKSVKDVLSIIGIVFSIVGLRYGLKLFFSLFSVGKYRLPVSDRTHDAVSPTATYAVTSERLLYYRADDIRILPLENVMLLRVVSRDGTRGTLGFGPVFPMWTNLEDAEHVKSIIEKAQNNRLKEIIS